jgi:hypothetical protein
MNTKKTRKEQEKMSLKEKYFSSLSVEEETKKKGRKRT